MGIMKSISDHFTCDEIKQYYARQKSFFTGFSERKRTIERIVCEFDKYENMECMIKRIIPNLLELGALGGYLVVQDANYLIHGAAIGEGMRYISGEYFKFKRMGIKVQKSEILAVARKEHINEKVYDLMDGVQDD